MRGGAKPNARALEARRTMLDPFWNERARSAEQHETFPFLPARWPNKSVAGNARLRICARLNTTSAVDSSEPLPPRPSTLPPMPLQRGPPFSEKPQLAENLVANVLGKEYELHDCHPDQALSVFVVAVKRARRSPRRGRPHWRDV